MMLIHAGSSPERRAALVGVRGAGGTLAQGAVLRAAQAAGDGAVAADGARRLDPGVVGALREAGFARHFVPRRWGGGEGGFADLVAATVLVGEQCPSAAWCAMLFAAHGRYAARLPQQAQQELWGAGPDPLIAAALAPAAGVARPVPGGWLLEGRWECVSGVDFCDWVLLAAPVHDSPAPGEGTAAPGQDTTSPVCATAAPGAGAAAPGAGAVVAVEGTAGPSEGVVGPVEGTAALGGGAVGRVQGAAGAGAAAAGPAEGRGVAPAGAGAGGVRVLAVPRGEVVVHDTWRSTGLRGTGSNSVEVRGVFVPDRRTCSLGEVLGVVVEPSASAARQASGHLAGGVMLCAAGLGAARLALRSWTRWAQAAAGQRAAALADPAVQRVLARSAAEIDAVALLLERAAAGADAEPTAARVEAVNRRDAAVAAEVLVEAVERLFRTGGAHVRDDAGDVQRAWRDVHTVAAHGALRLDAAAGVYAAGLGPPPQPRGSGAR